MLPASSFHTRTSRVHLRSRPVQRNVAPRCAAGDLHSKADVVVVGSGIIGISISRAILQRDSNATVTLLEKHEPCYGATGAGQGYIWLAHRNIGSPAWDMAVHSKQLWGAEIAAGNLSSAIEWQDSGSLLLAGNDTEAEQLEERAAALKAAGLSAELLDASSLRHREPALDVHPGMTGLLLQSDAQVNGRLAAETWLRECIGAGSRFSFLQHEGAASLHSAPNGGNMTVETDTGRRISAGQAVVLACGAWTGQLLADSLGLEQWRGAFQPRKGHLLEFQPPPDMPRVSHGLMELGYASHYKAQAADPVGNDLAITFAATTSASGSLLVGSSREFAGFDRQRAFEVERAILKRAAKFLPHLASVEPSASKTRVGLRPFSPTGPIVGQVPGVPGLLVAGGHEGSGLTLAPATAEIITAALYGGDVPEFAATLAPKPAPEGIKAIPS